MDQPNQPSSHSPAHIFNLFTQWTQILGLHDWRIRLHICHVSDFPEDPEPSSDMEESLLDILVEGSQESVRYIEGECYGLTQCDAAAYVADIWIADPSQVEHPHGVEVTLVHELLHVKWEDLWVQVGEGTAHRLLHYTAMLAVKLLNQDWGTKYTFEVSPHTPPKEEPINGITSAE